MAYFIQTLIDALSLGSLYALAALGIGLLFGILRLINFAHGDYITIGAYSLIVPSTAATATVFIGGWNAMALIVAVCVIVVAAALLSDRFVFRFLRRAHPATLMVASFALGYTIQNIVLMIYGSRPKSVGLWPSLARFCQLAAFGCQYCRSLSSQRRSFCSCFSRPSCTERASGSKCGPPRTTLRWRATLVYAPTL